MAKAKIVFFIILISIILLVVDNKFDFKKEVGFKEVAESHKIYKKVKNFKVKDFYGRDFELMKLQEEVILVNFWASWCETCIVELPAMINLVKDFEARIALVAISIDEDKESLIEFLKKLEAENGLKSDISNIYWIWDPKKEVSLKKFGTYYVPETIIINKDRVMVEKIVGFRDWKDDESLDMIKGLLE